MKKILCMFVILYFANLLSAQKPLLSAEYGEYKRPVPQNKYFADINILKDLLLKKNIANKLHPYSWSDGNGVQLSYTTWKTTDNDFFDSMPDTNFVGAFITQKIIYPPHLMNYSWQGCCYEIDDKEALGLTVVANKCDSKNYKLFCNKVAATVSLFGISLTSVQSTYLENKHSFIGYNNGFTIIFDNGTHEDYTTYDKIIFVIIPPINSVKRVYKIFDYMYDDSKRRILKDTLALCRPMYSMPFSNPDSVKAMLTVTGYISSNPMEIYPMYYSFEKTDSTVFTIIPGSNLIAKNKLAGNNFIIQVQQNYDGISQILLNISYELKPTKEQAKQNYEKLLKLFNLLNIDTTGDMDMWLKSVAAVDENLYRGITVNTKTADVTFYFMDDRNEAKIKIEPAYIQTEPLFVPYNTNK